MSAATERAIRRRQEAEGQSVLFEWRDSVALELLPPWTKRHLTERQAEKLRPVTLWQHLLRHSNLKPTARAVGLWLATFVRDEGAWIRCWPKVDDLAAASGHGEKTVRRALNQLEEAGWIRVVRHRMLLWPSDYILDLPGDVWCTCTSCDESTGQSDRSSDRSERPVDPDFDRSTGQSDQNDRSLSPNDRSLSPNDRSERPEATAFQRFSNAESNSASPDGEAVAPQGDETQDQDHPEQMVGWCSRCHRLLKLEADADLCASCHEKDRRRDAHDAFVERINEFIAQRRTEGVDEEQLNREVTERWHKWSQEMTP